MGKIKIKKNDVWIDMTPMSDVMVLLLTFFMLSANFVKNEVVKVVTPASQTMAKVPSSATLDITIDPEGRVLLGTDKTVTMEKALDQMLKERNVTLTPEQKAALAKETQVGLAMSVLPQFMEMTREEQTQALKNKQLKDGYDVILDSIQSRDDKMSEFQLWVKALKNGYKEWYNDPDLPEEAKAGVASKLEICIKADQKTPYSSVKKVIAELQDINESRYKLVTQYKKLEE